MSVRILVTWNSTIVCWGGDGTLRHRPISEIGCNDLAMFHDEGSAGLRLLQRESATVTQHDCAAEGSGGTGALLRRSVFLDSVVSLQGADGLYWCAQWDGHLLSNRPAAKLWEMFSLISAPDELDAEAIGAESSLVRIADMYRMGRCEAAIACLEGRSTGLPRIAALPGGDDRRRRAAAEILAELGRWDRLADIVGPTWDFHESPRVSRLAANRAAMDGLVADRDDTAAPVGGWLRGLGSVSRAGSMRSDSRPLIRKEVDPGKRRKLSMPRIEWPDNEGCLLPGARIIGHDNVCFSAGAGAFLHSDYHHKHYILPGASQERHVFSTPQPSERLSSLAIFLGGHINYFHNLLEYMINYFYFIKMRSLWKMAHPDLVQAWANATFIVRQPQIGFHFEIIDFLSIDKARCVFLDDHKAIHCDRLVLLPRAILGNGTVRDISAVEWLRAITRATSGSAARARRIYISRGDAKTRRVLNEDDVRALVERHGFDFMTLTGMTVIDQLRLFADAEAIIGPHGAGFTNLVATKRHCLVVELVAKNPHQATYFENLAIDLGHSHQRLESQPVSDDSDMVVDIDRLEAIILDFERR